jgi:hypothetical protein
VRATTVFVVKPAADTIIVQAVDRALLVDTLPATEQATGNAWAAQMLGIGGVIGFFLCVLFSLGGLMID